MVTDQTNITQTTAQVVLEAVKAAVQAITVTTHDGSWETRNELTSRGPICGRITLRQPTFDWCSTDKYAELKNFR